VNTEIAIFVTNVSSVSELRMGSFGTDPIPTYLSLYHTPITMLVYKFKMLFVSGFFFAYKMQEVKHIDPIRTKLYPSDLKTQSVPRSKHSLRQL
jgi:hypothetical protein